MDFGRFRVYLRDKYHVSKAFLFIGYVAGNESLYTYLQRAGYVLIFKPALPGGDGGTRGNVDAELVLHEMIECSNYDKAVIASGGFQISPDNSTVSTSPTRTRMV